MTYDPRNPQQQGGYYQQGQPSPPQPGYYGQPPGGPYSPAPLPYGAGTYASPRPTSATVLAIIGICLGGLAILNHGIGLLMLASGSRMMRGPGGGPPSAWMAADSAISLTIWITGLVGCVGLLRMAPWSRSLMVWWSVAYLIWLAICVVFAITVTVPHTLQNTPNKPAGVEAVAYGMVVCMLLLVGIYPILNLSLLTKQRVVQAYSRNY
jgi:hypothetical protein